MSKWKKLDLVRKDSRPLPEQLVTLRMIPTGANATFYKEAKYDIGKFETDNATGRKLWWHGTRGTQDPIKMKEHYDIWWCEVQPFES